MLTEYLFYIAIAILILGFIVSFRLYHASYQPGGFLSPVKCILASVFLSAVLLFLPIHLQQFSGSGSGILKSILLSIHSTMRLFVLDGEFDGVAAFTSGIANPGIQTAYSLVAAVLFVVAPALTFGFVLSFFKNISAYRDLFLGFASDIYVFSELNEQALVLAGSIKNKNRRSRIVFTDVFESDGESFFELYEKAKELKAICFKKDIASINWGFHSKSRCVSLFTMGNDESENIDQSIKLVDTYRNLPNFRLYVFSSSTESEALFCFAIDGGMRIRRVDVTRSLINQTLYRNGFAIFENAIDSGCDQKLISVVLIGLGQYGTEMLKTLSWFCQMDGYRVEINAFDKDPKAEEKFTMLCPELMSCEKNGTDIPGEARYNITIHSGVDVESIEFADCLQRITHVSLVFVALGSDVQNIQTAINMRMLSERHHQHPAIQAVVYNSLRKKALESITDYRGHRYEIEFIGDLQTSYSENVIIDSELESVALNRHLKWGKERDFWAYEFNYRSSVAAAIHLKMRILCNIPGASKREDDLTAEEREIIESLEHRRWNAYMRSEGYVFSGSTAASTRNDLAKMHNDLVPFCFLNEEEKRKDSHVGTR